MKQYFIKATIFFLPPLLFVFAFDVWLRNQNSLYKEKYNGILQAKDSIEVVVLGNSHAHYGVDPKQFSLNTYNLANVNQKLYFDIRLCTPLLDSLPNLEYVFISIDYHSLYSSSQGYRDIWSYYANGIRYKNKNYLLANVSPFLFGYTPRIAISFLKKNLVRIIKYQRDATINFDVESGVSITDSLYNGFLAFNGSNESTFTKHVYKETTGAFTKEMELSREKDEIINELNSFIELIKEKGVEVVLFTTPTYSEYNEYLDPHYIQLNLKDIEDISNLHGISYWNYMMSPEFNKDHFWDCDHLNKIGAEKFSHILNNRLMSK